MCLFLLSSGHSGLSQLDLSQLKLQLLLLKNFIKRLHEWGRRYTERPNVQQAQSRPTGKCETHRFSTFTLVHNGLQLLCQPTQHWWSIKTSVHKVYTVVWTHTVFSFSHIQQSHKRCWQGYMILSHSVYHYTLWKQRGLKSLLDNLIQITVWTNLHKTCTLYINTEMISEWLGSVSLKTTLANHNGTDVGVKYQTFWPQSRGPHQW